MYHYFLLLKILLRRKLAHSSVLFSLEKYLYCYYYDYYCYLTLKTNDVMVGMVRYTPFHIFRCLVQVWMDYRIPLRGNLGMIKAGVSFLPFKTCVGTRHEVLRLG